MFNVLVEVNNSFKYDGNLSQLDIFNYLTYIFNCRFIIYYA